MNITPLYRHGDGFPTHDDNLEPPSSAWPSPPLVGRWLPRRQTVVDVAVLAADVTVLALAARTVANIARRRPW